jgi:hypothetical protein
VVEITKETKEISFKLTTDKTSPAGTHRNLFCQLTFTKNGESIVANSGYSELRLDVPIVKATPAPTPAPVATKAPTPAAAPKRLTRLEQLRKEQEEREKAGPGGTTPPKK